MVFFSGFTGLIYQVTWQKYLSIYLGSHALSTSLTLASFFLFLSAGYYFIGRFSHKLHSNRILTYAYIEGFIGIYAIISPKLFQKIYSIWPSYPSETLLHFGSSLLFAFCLMGVPTFLMGATIPLLTQGLSRRLSEGHRIHSWVYGVNTIGAFAGAMVSGFYLLEIYGLNQSLNLTGIVNALICVFLIVYCKAFGLNFSGYEPGINHRSQWKFNLFLFISFLSGVISFGLESLIIRMANIAIGSSNYSYTIIVSTFIFSIAIGSFFASVSNERTGRGWLITNQILLLFTSIALYLIIPLWPDYNLYIRILFSNSPVVFPYYLGASFIFLLLVLLAPVALMGMTLPLLFQHLKREEQYLSETAGQMYAYNSWGAAIGATLLGYIAFFYISADQAFLIILALISLSTFLVLNRFSTGFKFFKFSPIAIFLICYLVLPKWEDHSFIPYRGFGYRTPPRSHQDLKLQLEAYTDKSKNKIIYSNYGPNTYTVVSEIMNGKGRSVFVNGKPDASVPGDELTRTLTALIPLTLAKKNEDIFIIGLGAGLSTNIASSFSGTQSVKVTEIASGVIDALPLFDKWNDDLSKKMDKVTIVNDDAYKILKNENKKYDLIFSEPSNTWVSGVEKIYTEEFLAQAATKLNPDGIYSQWFPLFSTSKDSFMGILYNFKKAFKYVTLWSAGGGATIIIASHSPIEVDLKTLEEKYKNNKPFYESIKRESAVDILFHQIWSDRAVSEIALASTVIHSIYQPTLAYQSGRAHYSGERVNLEALAKKYFLINKNTETFLTDQKKVQFNDHDFSHSLLWEKFANELPKSFYDNAQGFLKDAFSFSKGKISLVKERLYPTDLDKKYEAEAKNQKNKYVQYDYLRSEKAIKTPKKVNPGGYLPSELFDRYMFLTTIRETAYLKNVTKTLPKKCKEGELPCSATKMEILRFTQLAMYDQIEKLAEEYTKNKKEVSLKIDDLFAEQFQ